MKPFLFALLVNLVFVSGTLTLRADTGAAAILGIWHTTGDKSQVKIFQRDNHYFAQITAITWPNWPDDDKFGMAGKPRNDRNNPDPKLHSRPLLGLEIMSDFVYAGENLWDSGKIYDPESGKSYKCKMKLVSAKRLEVRGYIGFSLIGRTVVWTR